MQASDIGWGFIAHLSSLTTCLASRCEEEAEVYTGYLPRVTLPEGSRANLCGVFFLPCE